MLLHWEDARETCGWAALDAVEVKLRFGRLEDGGLGLRFGRLGGALSQESNKWAEHKVSLSEFPLLDFRLSLQQVLPLEQPFQRVLDGSFQF